MSLNTQISEHLTAAMRARDKERTTALRNIRAAFIAALKEDGATDLPDDKAFAVLRRLAKQRQESIEAYAAGGREEAAQAERDELAVINAYLPSLADEATTRGWVEQAVAAAGTTSRKDQGRVMGAIMKAHKDEVDTKLVSAILAQLLS